jgi:dimethylhistidine N-methyltransferase
VQQPTARDEILAGLAASRPAISPKFFYDALGSRLFCAITELDEYYPTRTEASILAAHRQAIAAEWGGAGAALIDLGAGDCAKAAGLFDAFLPAQYVAVDISEAFLQESLANLAQRWPGLEMRALAADLSHPLRLPDWVRAQRRLFFYPGSSIGNFSPEQAADFLAGLKALAGSDGGLLIGVDLVKDRRTLEAAYDDSLGVTAAFNLNLLRNANRIAGTDFDPADWRHMAFFNDRKKRIEMHLEARRAVRVSARGAGRTDGASPFVRDFSAGEKIHTENSYKYELDAFDALLRAAGFVHTRAWTDERAWFALFLAR